MLQGTTASVAIIGAGGLLACAGFFQLFRSELSQPLPRPQPDSANPAPINKRALIALALLICVFFCVGLSRIEYRGLSHVEAYVPGLDLPADISEPPPRTGLIETLRWHWHSEPHPPSYFVMMLGWTKVFGTSLTSIRMPGLLAGCLSIVMMYLIASRLTASQWGGLLAATLLGLNGFHLHIALMARHYEFAMLFGLLSLWFWLKLLADEQPDFYTEIGYLVSLTLGLYFHVLFWLFLLSQILYTTAVHNHDNRFSSRIFYYQMLAVIIASPMVLHSFYTGTHVQSGGAPSWAFTLDFLDFGFLFQADNYISRDVPPLLEILLVFISVMSIALFTLDRSTRLVTVNHSIARPVTSAVIFLGIGFSFILAGLVREVWRPNPTFWFIAVLPLLAMASYLTASRLPTPRLWFSRRYRQMISPLPVIAIVTLLLTYLISIKQPAAVSRGLLLAIPPLLLANAGGLFRLAAIRKKTSAAALLLLLCAQAYSMAWHRDFELLTDYRTMANLLEEALQSEDKLFIQTRSWSTTPMYYHMNQTTRNKIVTENFSSVAEHSSRIWTIEFWEDQNRKILQTLGQFEASETLEARYIKATLWERVD